MTNLRLLTVYAAYLTHFRLNSVETKVELALADRRLFSSAYQGGKYWNTIVHDKIRCALVLFEILAVFFRLFDKLLRFHRQQMPLR